MDEETSVLIEWLKQLPENYTIEWASDHLSLEQFWAGSWIDVRVTELEQILGWGWFWTIRSPADDRSGELPIPHWEFVAPYDLDLYAVFDPEPPNMWYIGEIPVPKGSALSVEQDVGLEQLIQAGSNRERTKEGGWSALAVSKALAKWTVDYAGRSDIQFRWNPDIGLSAMAQAAAEELSRFENGEETDYDLGGNLRATKGFIRFLTEVDQSDPSQAEEIMSVMRYIARAYADKSKIKE